MRRVADAILFSRSGSWRAALRRVYSKYLDAFCQSEVSKHQPKATSCVFLCSILCTLCQLHLPKSKGSIESPVSCSHCAFLDTCNYGCSMISLSSTHSCNLEFLQL